MLGRKVSVGDRFGRLVVEEEVPKEPESTIGSHRKSRRFKFKCDCGGGTITTWGSAESCGCIQREKARGLGYAKRKSFGEACFNGLYATYLNQATKKGIEFRLTREQFKDLTSQPCYYCGALPAQIKQVGRLRKAHGYYLHNGVDRVDPTGGYIADNTVAACKECNISKHVRPQAEFFEWVVRVHSHLVSCGLIRRSG